jgi:hypothetical protein
MHRVRAEFVHPAHASQRTPSSENVPSGHGPHSHGPFTAHPAGHRSHVASCADVQLRAMTSPSAHTAVHLSHAPSALEVQALRM